ncbi:MAG TPA: hypothetical protein GXZ87_06550 [Bacteroidales bacterium]|nr:hypothetical protein [Bacteroidales bacterium]
MIQASRINLDNYKEMKSKVRLDKSEIMKDAWWYFKNYKMTFSEALKRAWKWNKEWVSECKDRIMEMEVIDAKRQVEWEEYQKGNKNPFAWMTPEVMENYYRTTKYQGD